MSLEFLCLGSKLLSLEFLCLGSKLLSLEFWWWFLSMPFLFAVKHLKRNWKGTVAQVVSFMQARNDSSSAKLDASRER